MFQAAQADLILRSKSDGRLLYKKKNKKNEADHDWLKTSINDPDERMKLKSLNNNIE